MEALHKCFFELLPRTTPSGEPAGYSPETYAVILTVLDRTETVNLNWNGGDRVDGVWNITSRLRQGIKMGSHDPAASDGTAAVPVGRVVNATVKVIPVLEYWSLWLGIGADSKTPRGDNLCGPTTYSCTAKSGPYPGLRRGLGKGWAASEGVEVWLCKGQESCVGKTDPIATININWGLP